MLPLLACCNGMMLVVGGVSGAGSGSFPNDTLGSASSEFWVLVFGVIRGASVTAGDVVAVAENVGGAKVTNGG